jgi:hypothetical protein
MKCLCKNPILPRSTGTNPALYLINGPVSLSRKILFGTPNFPDFSKSQKNIFVNVHENFDFPTVGENNHGKENFKKLIQTN